MACLPPGPDGSAHLEISTRYCGRAVVLRLAGELDVNSTDNLDTAIQSALDRDPQLLVLDLSALEYTDCGGLWVMVSAHRMLASQQRSLYVTGCRGAVQRLMQITGTDQVLRPGPTTACPG